MKTLHAIKNDFIVKSKETNPVKIQKLFAKELALQVSEKEIKEILTKK